MNSSSSTVIEKVGHIYIRVSSHEQAETGNSIENQKSQCRDYAARNGIKIADIYIDAGISGRSLKRPEWIRLQSVVKNSEHIVAYSISRLSRSSKDFIAMVEWTETRGITLHTVKESIDTKSAYGTFMTLLFSGLSQLEANLTQERMAELNTRKLRRGETTKAPPFGYRSVKYSIGVPARLVPDLAEQEAISRMFTLRFQEQFHPTPFLAIAEKITEEGHHPRRSKAFTVESIRQIMTREYEFRMRVHGTLTISRNVIQRYVDLCMPFIVPYKEMEKFVVMGIDGRETYNGQYEDTSVVTERIYFFSAKAALQNQQSAKDRRKRKIVASSLDLHLQLYDKEREHNLMRVHLCDDETMKRRALEGLESREFRIILEQIISKQLTLDSKLAVMRASLSDELKMAELRYKLHIEENKSADGYNEMNDPKALELRLSVMQIKSKLSQCQQRSKT